MGDLILRTATGAAIVLKAAAGPRGPQGPQGSVGPPGPSDHTLLSNIGVATHPQIDAAITASASHIANTSNPHSVTKAQVGLANVDNTSDVGKPVSTAQQAALNLKANTSSLAPVATSGVHSALTGLAADDHPQYLNEIRGDARYAGQPYAVVAKAAFANLLSSYGYLGQTFGNSGYLNDLTVYGQSTQAGTPTPDVPVAIVSTTGNVTVRSDSKNLVVVNRPTQTINGITYTNNGDGTVTVNGTATGNSVYQVELSGAKYIRIVGGATYTTSGLPSVGSSTTFYMKAQTLNDDGTTSYIGAITATSVTSAPAKSGWAQPYITVRTGFVANNLLFKPQIEVSPVQTTFEKNTNSTQTLPLATTQLRSLPNGVADRIYKSGSSWYLEQNVGSNTYNGIETWSSAGGNATHYRFYHIEPTARSYSRVSSDRFVDRETIAGSDTAEGISGRTNLNYVYIMLDLARIGGVTTATAFKAWLASNTTSVLFELATPVTTTITDPTQIAALENVRTYQGITNITASTPVSGSYGLDLTASLAGKADAATAVTLTGTQTLTNKTLTNPVVNGERPSSHLAFNIGTTALYYSALFVQVVNFNTTAKFDGSVAGRIQTTGLFMPSQAPTASAPAYVKGALYFDTTLNKLRVGGASAWETITST